MTSIRLLNICEEIKTITDQLNYLSFNKLEDRTIQNQLLEKLSILDMELSGFPVIIKTTIKNH